MAFFIGWNMKTGKIAATIKIKWWVPAFIAGLKLFFVTFGTKLDYDLVGKFIAHHGVSIKVRFEETSIL